jgi:predicted RNase H-like HicB family nuclease
MNAMSFPVQFTQEDDGRFSVTCPVLQGCRSQGDTLEEARANIREAIALVLEDIAEHGEPLPDLNKVLTGSVLLEV